MYANTAASGKKKSTFASSIRTRQQEGLFPVISEVKVRSEKEGDLLRGRDPVALAREMIRSPVAGISVVTEPDHFGGDLNLLREIAAAVDLPVLHKDFITSERQIEESAASGASTILLITAMVESSAKMARLIAYARQCGLETLVEVHDMEEVEMITSLPFDLMGINNRDITIFEVDDHDVGRTEAIARFCKSERPMISESSIGSHDDVRRAGRSGADAVLVGTAVLKAPSISRFLKELTAVGWPP